LLGLSGVGRYFGGSFLGGGAAEHNSAVTHTHFFVVYRLQEISILEHFCLHLPDLGKGWRQLFLPSAYTDGRSTILYSTALKCIMLVIDLCRNYQKYPKKKHVASYTLHLVNK